MQVVVTQRGPLADVRLELGALTVLVGRNGSGKTTLLRAIEQPEDARPLAAWCLRAGCVSPERREHLDAAVSALGPAVARDLQEALAEVVPGTAEEASHGALAAPEILALVHSRPGALALIDEPETSLHPTAQGKLVERLRAFAESGHGRIVLATHSPYVVDAAGVENTWVLGPCADGRSVARRLSDNPAAASTVLTAGELWCAVGEGWVARS